ncbi:hypothetical protein F5Y15DRAFT_178239 [Xylariaceae sp. FL0016]|nr:hypothetical protein F5Y15DRAFT_178239 [Xylariaceae sp. FL0016]
MSRYEGESSYRGRPESSRDYVLPYPPSEAPPRIASPGRTTYHGTSQAKLTYEPQAPFYPSPARSPASLTVPESSRSRPRSLPPAEYRRRASREIQREREKHYRDRYGSSDDDERERSPLGKARHFVDHTFTDSTTGLGVGVLGALVGGLAAREAADATMSKDHHHHHGRGGGDDAEYKRNQLISTMVGAAVGALGANAVERRIEQGRERDRVKQERWERKWRMIPMGDDEEVVERRSVVARARPPRSRDWGDEVDDRSLRSPLAEDRDRWSRSSVGGRRGGGGGGLEREVDPGAKSWKTVEDWLWDDGERDRDLESGRPRSSGRGSMEGYQY